MSIFKDRWAKMYKRAIDIKISDGLSHETQEKGVLELFDIKTSHRGYKDANSKSFFNFLFRF